MLNNTEIYFISWIEILEIETISRMEKYVFQLGICLIIPPAFIYMVYSFRLSVHLFVHSFVRNSVPFVELLQSFTLKQLK